MLNNKSQSNVKSLMTVDLFLVFSVEENASADTLVSVSEWFKTGHNVAVSRYNFLLHQNPSKVTT